MTAFHLRQGPRHQAQQAGRPRRRPLQEADRPAAPARPHQASRPPPTGADRLSDDGAAATAGRNRDATVTRLAGACRPTHFRPLDDLTVSSIGLGTYLGDEDDATDARLRRRRSSTPLDLGCNLFDTAINYRAQRSERVARPGARRPDRRRDGSARERAGRLHQGRLPPLRRRRPGRSGGVRPRHLRQARAPRARGRRRRRATRSRRATWPIRSSAAAATSASTRSTSTTCTIPRPSSAAVAAARVPGAHRARAFATLEERGRRGTDRPLRRRHLERLPPRRRRARPPVARRARAPRRATVAGDGHHFRVDPAAVQPRRCPRRSPRPTQVVGGERLTALDAAARLGITVDRERVASCRASSPRRLPQRVARGVPGLDTPAQRALQFVRSTPGVTTALVGMSAPAHVDENLAVARVPPAPAGVDALFRDG